MIKASNVHKTFEQLAQPLHVLKGINLELSAGDFISISGPSGAGKSTLLHILGGLDQPTQGQVMLEGENIHKLSDRRLSDIRNKKFGFVFQFYHLLPEFSAMENIFLPGLVAKNTGLKRLKERALFLLDRVGLKQRADHRPYQLSGGEQQRVAIARALMNEPELILCDEPTGNLDSQSGQDVLALLTRLNQESGQALIIVTHDENLAEKARRRLRIKDGVIIS